MAIDIYDDRVFSVAEAADIIGIPESYFRTLNSRAGDLAVGRKRDGRILYTPHEICIAALAYDLTGCAYPPADAFRVARELMGHSEPPAPGTFAKVTSHRACFFRTWQAPSFDELPEPETLQIVLPLGEKVAAMLDGCAKVYEADAR